MTIEKAVHWLIAHWKLVILLSILGTVLYIAYGLAATYAVINVQISGDIKNLPLSVHASSDSKTEQVGSSGLVIIRRDTKSLLVNAGGRIRTQTPITIPWFGYLEKRVSLVADRDAEKVAFRSATQSECATYAKTLEQLLYYDCNNPSSLTRYLARPTGPWSEQVVAKMSFSNDTAMPYLGGVIGITYTKNTEPPTPPDITYVTSEGRLNGLNAPLEMDEDLVSASTVFTDNNPTNNRFVLVGGSGEIYLAEPDRNFKNVEYKKISAPAKYNQDFNQVTCSLSDATVYCFYARRGIGDMPDKFDWESIAKPSIVRASFDDDSVERSDINAPIATMNKFYATSGGDLFILNNKRLDYLKKSSGGYTLDEVSQNVDSASGGGKNMYFAQDGGVFVVNPQTLDSNQVFYSQNVYARAIYQTDSDTFIIGFTGGDDSYTYAYRLLDRENPTDRLLDKLPFDTKDVDYVLTNDLVGERLYVRVYTPFRPPASIDKLDTETLSKIKNSISTHLFSIGIDTADIQYSL